MGSSNDAALHLEVIWFLKLAISAGTFMNFAIRLLQLEPPTDLTNTNTAKSTTPYYKNCTFTCTLLQRRAPRMELF